jgi:hypothetical protein
MRKTMNYPHHCSDSRFAKLKKKKGGICTRQHLRGCIQKFPDWLDNEINNTNESKHSLTSNAKGYGGKTHWTDSQNSDTIAPSGRELYHLQFSLQAASPETFGYTLIPHHAKFNMLYRNVIIHPSRGSCSYFLILHKDYIFQTVMTT